MARLRDAGLRATQARVQLLEWLDAHAGHHAAEQLVEETGLSKATVYHALGQLLAAGLLLTAETDPGRLLYETAQDAHHHFVCGRCGRVIDVPEDVVGPLRPEALAGVSVERVDVILRGRCDDCR